MQAAARKPIITAVGIGSSRHARAGILVVFRAMFGLNYVELLVIGTVAVLLFGWRLPRVTRDIQRAFDEFRRGVNVDELTHLRRNDARLALRDWLIFTIVLEIMLLAIVVDGCFSR
jgi:hypothetical protein